MNELSFDANIHRHVHKYAGRPDETAGHGHDLPDVARNRDGDQIEAADAVVRRIEGDPARTRHIDFRPGMGRPRTPSPYSVLIRIIEITGYDPASACGIPTPSIGARRPGCRCSLSNV